MGTQGLFAFRPLARAPGERAKLLTIRLGIQLHEFLQRRITLFDKPGAPAFVLLFPSNSINQRCAWGCHIAAYRLVILGSQYLRNQSFLPTAGPNLQPLTNLDRLSKFRGETESIEGRRREGD